MPEDRAHSCLPCRDLDESIAFYAALGFVKTYRQLKPNPYAVVARGTLHMHLFGMPDFDPAQSYACALIVLEDCDATYEAFAAGLRAAYGKLPASGIPRILRPRKKLGMTRGFSIVDPGGNWLRFTAHGDDDVTEKSSGLPGIVDTAARLGDSHGDEAKALEVLRRGLQRHADAPAIDRARALVYGSELAARSGDQTLARAWLDEVHQLALTPVERDSIATELAAAIEVVDASA